MLRFTKAQMLNELRTIFLFEADHIAVGAGSVAAENFMGFASDQYWREAPERVELNRFQISMSFERGFDYAFAPSLTNTFGEHEVQDLNVFMQGTPRAGGQGVEGGETHDFMTQDGFCRTVCDAVFARWKLEWEQQGDFTTRELALLANMTEGAVRNALADKSEAGLRAIPRSKPIAVGYEEAKRWLMGRRGFVPFPQRPKYDSVLHENLNALRTAEGLGELVRWQLWNSFGDSTSAASTLRWPADELEHWVRGTFPFDLRRASELAEALDLDVPTFVGKAAELSLRRDTVRGEG